MLLTGTCTLVIHGSRYREGRALTTLVASWLRRRSWTRCVILLRQTTTRAAHLCSVVLPTVTDQWQLRSSQAATCGSHSDPSRRTTCWLGSTQSGRQQAVQFLVRSGPRCQPTMLSCYVQLDLYR